MNRDPTPNSRVNFTLPLVLTLVPGLGAFVGTVTDMEAVTLAAFFCSPLFALAAGIILGLRTGHTAGMKAAHAVGWSVGCLACSVMVQWIGCTVTR